MSTDQVFEQENEKARKKGCGVVLTLALLGFLILVVPVVGYLFFTMRAAKLVDAELAEIRAAGEPATAEELNDYYEYPPAEEDATQLWLAAVKPFENRNEKYGDDCGELPIVGDSEEPKIIPPPGEEWEDLEAVEEFLAKYADSIKLLHQAVDKGGAARYPVDFSKGIDAMCRDGLFQLPAGARVLSLQTHVRAHRGDTHGVAESIHAIFMLGQSLEKEPSLISQFVRMAIQGIACELLLELLPYVEFSDDDLASLRADIQAIDNDTAFERAMIGERVWAVNAFRNPASLAGSDDSAEVRIAARFGARNDELLLYLQSINGVLAATRKPWPQRLHDIQAVQDELQTSVSGINRFRYIMTSLSPPDFAAFTVAFARNEVRIRAADAALAIEHFSRKNDRLPDKLDELVPEFLDSVPIDPFDGKPLRYVVREDAYMIYSIGTDRVDDGGQILEEEDEFGNYVENPDIIFPVKRVRK